MNLLKSVACTCSRLASTLHLCYGKVRRFCATKTPPPPPQVFAPWADQSYFAKVGPLRARVKSAKVRATAYVYDPRVVGSRASCPRCGLAPATLRTGNRDDGVTPFGLHGRLMLRRVRCFPSGHFRNLRGHNTATTQPPRCCIQCNNMVKNQKQDARTTQPLKGVLKAQMGPPKQQALPPPTPVPSAPVPLAEKQVFRKSRRRKSPAALRNPEMERALRLT